MASSPTTASKSEVQPAPVICNPNPIDLLGLLEGPPAPIVMTTIATTGSSSSASSTAVEIPSTTARLLVDCRCQLGECCLWDDLSETIVFISILDKTFHKLHLSRDNTLGSKLQTYRVPKMIGAIGLLEYGNGGTCSDDSSQNHQGDGDGRSGSGYLVAWEDGFQLYDIEGGRALSRMSRGEVVPLRLNDGRVDPTGTRFVCGGCASPTSGPLKVFKCEYDHETHELWHTPVVDEIRVTNSICWSLDGKTMYLADSPTQQIHKLDYDLDTGLLSNKQLLHTKPTGNPDGSVVDSLGYLWNATWREGQGQGFVDRICPKTGQTVFRVHLPDDTSEASCVCFGGPNLDILFITTAWEHLDPSWELNAGGLYAVKLPPDITGCKEKRFRVNVSSFVASS